MKMSPVRYAACVCLLLLPLHLGYAASALTGERIAALLRAEDPEALATVSGQTVYGAPLIRQMYAARGYEPLWCVEAIVAFSDALDRLEADGLTPGDYRFAEIAPQLGTPDVSALGPAEAAEVDILLTEAFVRATYNLYFGKADPERLDVAKVEDELTITSGVRRRCLKLPRGMARLDLAAARLEGASLRVTFRRPAVAPA